MFNPNDRERRVLDKIKAIKKPTKKIVVNQPKKVLSNQEQKLKQVEDILFKTPKGEKPTVTLEKVLKLIKI